METTQMRTHYCGNVNATHIGQEVELCGWVHRRRDHGGVIFIDLRDREGLVQVVYDPDLPAVFKIAEQIRNEFVVAVRGRVRARPEGSVNADLASGEIEVLGQGLDAWAGFRLGGAADGVQPEAQGLAQGLLRQLGPLARRRRHGGFQPVRCDRGHHGALAADLARSPRRLGIIRK